MAEEEDENAAVVIKRNAGAQIGTINYRGRGKVVYAVDNWNLKVGDVHITRSDQQALEAKGVTREQVEEIIRTARKEGGANDKFVSVVERVLAGVGDIATIAQLLTPYLPLK